MCSICLQNFLVSSKPLKYYFCAPLREVACNCITEILVLYVKVKKFCWQDIIHNVNPDINACLAIWCGILQELVEEESLHHSDIIQEGFVDSYNNLTLKSVMMLKWVLSNCHSVRYIMKTDDDMFVNINNLVRLLKVRNMSNLLVGALICGARPIADTQNKWWVSAAFIDMNCLFKEKGVFGNFRGYPYLCMCTLYTSECDIMELTLQWTSQKSLEHHITRLVVVVSIDVMLLRTQVWLLVVSTL